MAIGNSLSAEICRSPRNEIHSTHARTNCPHYNAFSKQTKLKTHFYNLFWHGSYESQIFCPQLVDYNEVGSQDAALHTRLIS